MNQILARVLRAQDAPAIVAVVLAFAIFSATTPAFFSIENLQNIVVQSSFILFIAIGMTFVIAAGSIDLSVGSNLGLCAGVCLFVISFGYPSIVGVAAAMAVGLLVGAINGILVGWARINDFIVTLGTLGLAGGSLQLLDTIRPLRADTSVEFDFLVYGDLAGVPFPIILSLIAIVVMGTLLNRAPYGRKIRAVGMSSEASQLAGLDVTRLRVSVFLISGLFSAFAGILMASRLSSVAAGLGQGFELQAIVAAVIGGASLAGGRGSVLGSAAAALLLAMISSGLQISGVDATWYRVFIGLAIVVAVWFHSWSHAPARWMQVTRA